MVLGLRMEFLSLNLYFLFFLFFLFDKMLRLRWNVWIFCPIFKTFFFFYLRLFFSESSYNLIWYRIFSLPLFLILEFLELSIFVTVHLCNSAVGLQVIFINDHVGVVSYYFWIIQELKRHLNFLIVSQLYLIT